MTSMISPNKYNPIFSARLGDYQPAVESALKVMRRERIITRIWERDHTVWNPDPSEISNRLGWLDVAERMETAIPSMLNLAMELNREGYQKAVLLGMGGSSLAPEVFIKIFGKRGGFLDLVILDSTDPGAVLGLDRQLDLAHTLFIVSTKSGTTTETLSFFKYFYNRVVEELGRDQAGAHFIAITDPDSLMVKLAGQHHFRSAFINDPNIGGRYSALSYFGLVPAALIGIDLPRLLENSISMAEWCKADDNLAGYLGIVLGVLAKTGQDKVSFILSPRISSFGDWLEQLIAESTGKTGTGILPVVGELPGPVSVYGSDRLFVSMQLKGDESQGDLLKMLSDAGHPVISFHLNDRYDLGGQFFLWEMATAVAGYQLGIQPFDQPNVEVAKILARKIIVETIQNGIKPELKPVELSPVMLRSFMDQATQGAYIAIQAYINPERGLDQVIQYFRDQLRKKSCLATTLGYGPRFLHSTGQLHKGDAGKGLFIQLTSRIVKDVNIPDEAGRTEATLSFGTLLTAQVLGDQQALLKAGRKVIQFELDSRLAKAVEQLNEIMKDMD